MRKWISIIAVAALLVTTPALVPDAFADHETGGYYGGDAGWVFSAGIRLGGFHLSIGYQPVRYGAPTYYYRTREAIHYDGYRCSDRCYRRGDVSYHSERCPVVLHLMHLNRIHPDRLFAYHAPDYDGRWRSYDPYVFDRDYRRSHGLAYGDRYEGRRGYDGRRSYGYDSRDWRDRRYEGRRHDGRRYEDGRHRGGPRGRRHYD